MEEKTRWQGQSDSQIREEKKRSDRLVCAAETSKELAGWCRLQRKKLEHTWPTQKERVASVPQREQLARTPEPLLPKEEETETSVQSTELYGGRESR